MPESKLERVGRLAERSAERTARTGRAWTITEFERHPDGYLCALVTSAGHEAIYVHRRYGSWMIPVDEHGKMREVPYELAVDLQVRARALERMERRSQNGSNPDSEASDVGEANEGAVRSGGGDQGTAS